MKVTKVMKVMKVMRISLHICISLYFSGILCIYLHFSSFIYISLHFSAFLYISLHFSAFLYISLHFSALLSLSLNFSEILCISLHFSALLYISQHFSAFLYIYLHCSTFLYICLDFSAFYILGHFDGAYHPMDAIFYFHPSYYGRFIMEGQIWSSDNDEENWYRLDNWKPPCWPLLCNHNSLQSQLGPWYGAFGCCYFLRKICDVFLTLSVSPLWSSKYEPQACCHLTKYVIFFVLLLCLL